MTDMEKTEAEMTDTKIKNNKSLLCRKIMLAAGIIIGLMLISVLIYGYRVYNTEPISDETIAGIKNSKAKKLMIVAHPDDEALWGGLHLLEDKYYVVCLTNGNNSVRVPEFYKVLEATGNDGIILSYPDKVFFRRDNWNFVSDRILSDIERVVDAGDWELIVTHNPSGEYGHEHHIKTSGMVTDICEKKGKTDKLFYFGRYYRKKELEEEKKDGSMAGCSDGLLEAKEELLKLYVSQESTIAKFSHMNSYENWIPFKEWED